MTDNTAANQAWEGFTPGDWNTSVNVRDFIQKNYTPYSDDASFLAGPTDKTLRVWDELKTNYFPAENAAKRRLYDIDVTVPSGITAFGPGYISEDDDVVPGLQTDVPLKRAMMPNGGWKMVETALIESGRTPDARVKEIFTKYRKTHNEAVFDVYTPRVRAARSAHILTGLADAYGRGRIIGDYRRIALYGVDVLIAQKVKDKDSVIGDAFTEGWMRFREEHSAQIKALKELKEMGLAYGLDLARPARNAKEAVQWTYAGYLASIKSQDGAAMSVGRVSAFLDIYTERDLAAGTLTEQEAQELVDHFIIKLRLVRFLRTEDYDAVFAGDPVWATLTLAGTGEDGRTLTTKTDFRILQTLRNLGAAPEPNITVFWSPALPVGFRNFCTEISIETSAIQYENDEVISNQWGDDVAIACCVSPMQVGKSMQFFSSRANGLKALLYAVNGGRDEKSGKQVATAGIVEPILGDGRLDYDEVWERYEKMLTWLAEVYVEALNAIHYMHDKYAYEAVEMALHDAVVYRSLACGIAGLSHITDSLSAIKYALVYPIRDDRGLVVDYRTEGEFPLYGNDDDRADDIAKLVVSTFMKKIREQPVYRDAVPTMSALTITSNVVYGAATSNSPDGRRAGEPFAPGANPSYGAEKTGVMASVLSVAKLPFEDLQDGISLTTAMSPGMLGRTTPERISNLRGILDAGFADGLYHMNVNILDKATIKDALEFPEKYPNLVLRISGYAVYWSKISTKQREDIYKRTYFDKA